MSTSTYRNQLIDIVDSAVSNASSFVASHKLRPSNDADVAMVCLYLTIIENAKACVVLAKQGCDFSMPPIARAAFEAFVDVMQLDKDPGNVVALEVKRNQQKKSAMKAALKLHKGRAGPTGEKLFHSAIEEANNFLNSLPPGRRRLEERSELIRKADATGALDMLYVELCDWSHNNSNVLRKRHLMETESGDRFIFFRPLEITFLESISGALIIFLFAGIAPLLRIGGCTLDERTLVSSGIEKCWVELNRLLTINK